MGWPTRPALYENGTVGLDLPAPSPQDGQDSHHAVGGAKTVPSAAALQEPTMRMTLICLPLQQGQKGLLLVRGYSQQCFCGHSNTFLLMIYIGTHFCIYSGVELSPHMIFTSK